MLPTALTSGERRRPRVVIIGGGFGGLYAARALARQPVEITLLDRTNHHLFQPLLYQVATAALSPSDIAVPIRWRLRRYKNITVLLAEARSIDVDRRVVVTGENGNDREVSYDFLIVATGSRHAYFGHDEWEPLAPGLKSLEDALEIRRRFLRAFEEAEKSDNLDERDAWQTFVIVGGGPTGAELAGVLPEIARNALRPDFRHIDTRNTRVLLLEGGPRVLSAFPPELSARAQRDLEKLGVTVRTNCRVTNVTPDAVWAGDERFATHTVFWAAGNAASPLGKTLGAPVNRAGQVLVEPDLSLPSHPEVFVIGDLAYREQDGAPLPAVAPAAMQMGTATAANIARTLRGEPRRPFHYHNKGNLATIGRNKAVADFGRVHVAGFLAWLLWLFVHILYLAGFRNRLSVLLEWGYAYFTYDRGARLITDREDSVAAPGLRPIR